VIYFSPQFVSLEKLKKERSALLQSQKDSGVNELEQDANAELRVHVRFQESLSHVILS